VQISSSLLTVIIFTYNNEDYIDRAIESVIEQKTAYPHELWISDDCSSDGTLAICRSYSERYPDKIRLFTQPSNTGSDPSKVPHSAIAIASVKTKYFCVLDGDDSWCDNQKLQIALDILENQPQYITFAHDTLYNDIANQTKRSLVHDIHNIKIENPVLFENAPYLHTSSRIHRNIVKYSKHKRAKGDIFLFYTYLDKGPLYYYDKVMSIYNISGKGIWSGLSQAEKVKAGATTQYELNRYFNYKHDIFFTRRVGETKRLNTYKKIFGKRLGWELWYHLEIANTFTFAPQAFKSKIRQFARKIFWNNEQHE
jgi:glycosyltransferase involved in cell wall biosynthesis